MPERDWSSIFIRGAEREWVEVGEGVWRQILGYDGTVMMVRIRFRKGAVGALHRHPHRQTSLVEEGAFEVEIDGRREVLRAGDGYFVPPELLHGVVALEDGVLVDTFAPAREDFLG